MKEGREGEEEKSVHFSRRRDRYPENFSIEGFAPIIHGLWYGPREEIQIVGHWGED